MFAISGRRSGPVPRRGDKKNTVALVTAEVVIIQRYYYRKNEGRPHRPAPELRGNRSAGRATPGSERRYVDDGRTSLERAFIVESRNRRLTVSHLQHLN